MIKGGIAFSENHYWVDSSNELLSKYGNNYPANVFDSNSNLYTPLEKYKTYLKNTLGKTSIITKLMTYEDLISLGCNESLECETGAPSWVYDRTYWTASAQSSYIWVGIYTGTMPANYAPYEESTFVGLRPVITISKSEL